jgi:hypothetical protein
MTFITVSADGRFRCVYVIMGANWYFPRATGRAMAICALDAKSFSRSVLEMKFCGEDVGEPRRVPIGSGATPAGLP